jgi:hypothetical protein
VRNRRSLAGLAFLIILSSIPCVPTARAQLGDDEVVVTTEDGTQWTRAKIDSALAQYPDYVRRAFKREGLVWQAQDPLMSFADLAAAAAPVLWFSPDEPLLGDLSGKDIDLPTAMGFEPAPEGPVVYFRIRKIVTDPDRRLADPPLQNVDPGRMTTHIDLRQVNGIDIDYFFYYPEEAGFGAHQHDVESIEVKLLVVRADRFPELGTWVVVQRVVAKAHGVLWYDNTLEVDRLATLPLHILVEEGKHASCTDRNADGFFTPGFDVNRRVNDAWGVRDVMAGGGLYTGSFQSWMAKPRRPEYRVFPPLPAESPLRQKFTIDGTYAAHNAIYELRPFPRPEDARGFDAHLADHFIADKGDPDWPEVKDESGFESLAQWVESEPFVKSLSISYRHDGDHGLSFVFPLLIVKNVADPLAGGWFVNRVYLKDHGLRDFSWNVLYTPSASRWLDTYFAIGFERDKWDGGHETHMMAETGIKLRFIVARTPFDFMSTLTDFWGVRIGVKNLGVWEWDHIGYAVEIGAGSF